MHDHDTISTTELVRNLSAIIDRVRVDRRPLAITKGSKTVAELNPPPRAGLPVAQLGDLLASLPRLGAGAGKFTEDLARARRAAALPGSAWD